MHIKEIIDMINKGRIRKVRRGNAGKFAIGASVGTVIGIFTGLLLAPKSGREMRKDLANTAGNLSGNVAQKVEEAGKSISKVWKSSDRIIKNIGKKPRKINLNADSANVTEVIIEPDNVDTTTVEIEAEGETEEGNIGEKDTEEGAEEKTSINNMKH